MIKPWTREEFASLLDCLRRHTRLQNAVIDHNRVWKTNRSSKSVECALARNGCGTPGDYLRISASRVTDIPAPEQVKRLIDVLKKKPAVGTAELCNDLDTSPRRLEGLVKLARDMGYRVEMPTSDVVALNVKAPPIDRLAVHRLPMEPIAGKIRFAVASDLHFASKHHRRECLIDFVDFAYNEFGVRRILVPGDVHAGMRMYPGQQNEVVSLSMEVQVRESVEGLPRRDGLAYDMIGGNHDESFLKSAGADCIALVGKARSDVKTYGYYSALFDIMAPGCKKGTKIELHHPDKAGAYAISYHMQKEIEQIPPGMKPHLIFMGHTHVTNWLPDYRGVAGFYCGTFEDQSLYLKRKHVAPSIGGWIIDLGIAADGAPKSLTATWVKYYHSVRGQLIAQDLMEPDRQVRLARTLSPIEG